jgi:hypothetical protein
MWPERPAKIGTDRKRLPLSNAHSVLRYQNH